MPELRYTSRSGGTIKEVSRYGASTFTAKTSDNPSDVTIRALLAVPHTGVVDDRVVAASGVGLLGHLPHAGDRREVSDDHARCVGQGSPGIGGTGVIAGMQRHLVAIGGEQAGGHQAKTVGGTGDEDLGHGASLLDPSLSRAT